MLGDGDTNFVGNRCGSWTSGSSSTRSHWDERLDALDAHLENPRTRMKKMSEGNGRLLDHSDKHSLRFERLLTHPPERVWRALTEDDELALWFPARIDGAREPGATLRFVFPPKAGQVPADSTDEGATMPGQMLVFDPPSVLEYEWLGDVLRWELDPRGENTLLTFSHTFADKARAARDASGWDICLASLGSLLAGVPAEPFTPERHDVLFERYAQKFGPDAAVLRAPPDL